MVPVEELVALLQVVCGDAEEGVGGLLRRRQLCVVGDDQDGGEAVARVGPRARHGGLGALAEGLRVADRVCPPVQN